MSQLRASAIKLDRIDKSLLTETAKIVDSSGVLELLEKWKDDDRAAEEALTGKKKNPGGRPQLISPRACLILMLALGIQSNPLHITRASQMLTEQCTPKAWEFLGLNKDDYALASFPLEQTRWYNRVYHGLRRIFSVMDPYPETSCYRRIPVEQYNKLKSTRDKSQVLTRKARATVFSNKLVEASYKTFGDNRLSKWTGDVTVDATVLEVTKRGKYKNSSRMPSTPMAGWYRRDHDDHQSHEDDPKKFVWGFELHLSAMTGDNFGGEGNYPALIAGVSFDKPGKRVAENALKSVDLLINNPQAPKGYFTGDKAYPSQRADKLHIPLRQAGYKLLWDIRKDTAPTTSSFEGAVQVDGQWFCPSIAHRKGWTTARQDYANGTINRKQLDTIITQRQSLALKLKETKPNGDQRFMCPASGKCPSVSCGLSDSRGSKTKDVRKGNKRLLPVLPVHQPKSPGKLCTQGSITIPVDYAAKHAQQGHPWMSKKWEAHYSKARNVIETRNDKLKNARGVGIGDCTSRLIRGWVGQFILASVGVAALNVQLIQAWLLKQTKTPKPTNPGGRPPKKSYKPAPLEHVADGNAPPIAA